jgi:hypothetical protein
MRICLILFQLLFVCVHSQAQSDYFNRTNDVNGLINAYCDLFIVNQDTSLVSGFLISAGKRYNTYTFISNQNGDTLRSFNYARDTIDIYGGMIKYSFVINNIIFTCGCYYKNGNAYANFMKFSLDGDLILDSLYYIPVSSQYAWTQFNSMLPLDDGNFMILGLKEVSYGNLDSWLVKMDPNGNILWEQTYGGPEINGSSIIVKTNDDNYIISSSKKTAVGADSYIIKVDGYGNIIWDKIINNTVFAESANISHLNNGDLLITGYNQFDNNKYKAWLSRLDSGGNLIWEYFFEKPIVFSGLNTFINSIELTNGNLIVFGCVRQFIDNYNPKGMLYCFSPKGDSLWSRYYKVRNNDNYINDLKLLDNGDFLMSGYVFPDSQNNTQDGWLMRTNCLGYFEHPKDSLVLNVSGSILTATNNASYFEYTTISWGDGDIDTLYENEIQYMEHQYTIPGMYDVTSTTVACSDTISHHYAHTVTPTIFSELDLSVFPNPSDGLFEIWLNSDDLFDIDVLDLNGRIVKQDKNILLKTGYQLNLIEMESAVYFIRARAGNQVYQSRVVIAKTL